LLFPFLSHQLKEEPVQHTLQFLQSIWHAFQLAAPWLIIAFIPSVIVGLTKFPRRPGALCTLMRILNFLSVLTHSDWRGTFKMPLAMSSPPSGRPPRDATCGPLSGGMSAVISMGPVACVIAVVAVLWAMAMNGCESCARGTSTHAIDMVAPAPLVCDAQPEPLRVAVGTA
jgi:hypothetical protein